MTKKSLLLTLVLGGLLLSDAQTMLAPPANYFKNKEVSPAQEPLDIARSSFNKKKIEDMQRSLTAVLSTDADGKHPAMNFAQNDKQIFLVWHERTGAKGDQIRVSWVAEAVDGSSKGRVLSEEAETLPGDGSFKSNFYLSPAKADLPLGVYRANLYKNTTLVRILKFTVKRRSAEA